MGRGPGAGGAGGRGAGRRRHRRMAWRRPGPGLTTVTPVRLTFYGVRGSCPCAGDAYRRVGGNTSCSLVSVDGEPPLVLDLGTGMRALGEALRQRTQGPLR